MTEVKKEEIGYAWNLVADLGNGRQLSISGNFPKGATSESVNTEFDKMVGAFNRQQAKSAAIAVEQEVDRLVLQREEAVKDLAMIDEKHSKKGGPNTNERAQREAAVVHIAKMGDDIEYRKKVLSKLKDEAK